MEEIHALQVRTRRDGGGLLVDETSMALHFSSLSYCRCLTQAFGSSQEIQEDSYLNFIYSIQKGAMGE